MGILYETAKLTQHGTREGRFLFNRSLETRERNDPDRKFDNEFQEQKGQMLSEQIPELQVPIRNYASIGSDVKEVLEKAEQLDDKKDMSYGQPALSNSNKRAAQQLIVHRTEAYGYFDELGKKLGKIAKNTETKEDDRYAESLRGRLGAELANINSVSVGDVENAFYGLSK